MSVQFYLTLETPPAFPDAAQSRNDAKDVSKGQAIRLSLEIYFQI